mmetsp:Transcript_16/g.57  ORF Transcript_16/g.57 Transcript_16/m.57 type:complete len:219 (+) Transcript_16:816-1472(+)
MIIITATTSKSHSAASRNKSLASSANLSPSICWSSSSKPTKASAVPSIARPIHFTSSSFRKASVALRIVSAAASKASSRALLKGDFRALVSCASPSTKRISACIFTYSWSASSVLMLSNISNAFVASVMAASGASGSLRLRCILASAFWAAASIQASCTSRASSKASLAIHRISPFRALTTCCRRLLKYCMAAHFPAISVLMVWKRSKSTAERAFFNA